MRGQFGYELYKHMASNKDIFLLTGDLGYKLFDLHLEDFKERAINCGASEQSMLDIACGLAIEGKIPVVYSITPFLLYRGFETIRTYINHEKLPVILIGSGRDKNYAHDGFSHDASDDKKFMPLFENIVSAWPETIEDMRLQLKASIDIPAPTYINLVR
jgi:transketolase